MLRVRKLLAVTLLLNAGFSHGSCGITDNIAQGNIASKNVFSRFVKDKRQVNPNIVGMPDGYISAESYGATGSDASDDTLQLQHALNHGKKIWLAQNGIYRISRKLKMPQGSAIMSDGTATILMKAGATGFSNTLPQRSDSAIYGDKGTGIEISGSDATLQDISIVKEYEDNRYVIAVNVVRSNNVVINKVAIRGFSIAPGIITISSSQNAVVSNSVIHNSCSKSAIVPKEENDLPSFQITGIVIDDSRYNSITSDHLRISNNVIVDLIMHGSERGDQTDAINYAGAGIGNDILISLTVWQRD